jgi:fatty acid desaturase
VHVFAVLLLANQLHALTILQHDCGHGSAYQNSRWNTWVGRFLAWFIFMPFTTFTEAHKRHHKYLGDPHNDPDEWFYANGGLWLFARECVFVPRFVYISLTRYGKQTARTVWFELLFNTMSWALLLALALQTDRFYELTMIMLLPVALLACVINPISRGYEHYPLTQLEPDDARRLDLRYNTVTVTNRWLGLMWANITYHVEHHMYPRAPFYRLPRINELMRDKSYIKEPLPLYSILNRKLQLTVRNNEN